MADTDPYIRDESGRVIGEWRDGQDPNFPQRYTEDDQGNRLVHMGDPVQVSDPAEG
jgi:hypothetical protein